MEHWTHRLLPINSVWLWIEQVRVWEPVPTSLALSFNWRPKFEPVDAQCPHGAWQLVSLQSRMESSLFSGASISVTLDQGGQFLGMSKVGWVRWVEWVPTSPLRFGPQRSFP